MPAELKTTKKTIESAELMVNIEINDDNRRPLGLAAHNVLATFKWEQDDKGHATLKKVLSDIKAALGVRAPRGDGEAPEKDAEKATKPAQKRTRAPKKDAAEDKKDAGAAPEGGEKPAAAFNPFEVPADAAGTSGGDKK